MMIKNILVALVLGASTVPMVQEAVVAAPQAKVAQRAPMAAVSVGQWFTNFDQIMRSNIITMQEKEQCDGLLVQAIMPNFDKASARNLLTGLSNRYMRGAQQLDAMAKMPQTKQLYEGYAWYYAETAKLFQTYLKLIDNPMGLAATDESGQLLAPQLVQKKDQLIQVRQALIALDQKVRNENAIATPAIGM
ncbi:MAG: hypothetical protein K2X81_06045 [Candidatus Obscuribacterales bacterium]|nr:hypothetical protein [Candidatus Obscuribacterales bacterium]